MDNKIEIFEDRKTFEQEQDHLLQTILDYRFFKPWKRTSTTTMDVPKGSLELFITPTCNQTCEYCYLQKYPELYPIDRNQKENIITNFRHVLDWVIENEFLLPNLDLFSGEIWHTPFGLEILDIVYEYITEKGLVLPSITIPTNATFLEDENQTIEIQNRIDDFKKIGCSIVISLSVDGKYTEEFERPRNDNSQRDDAFYEKMFSFAKHNSFGFHPMLAAKSAKYWKKNFQWWLKMLRKYDIPLDCLMILEVRNNDWEEEDILAYQDFIRFLMKMTFDFHDGNIYDAADDLMMINQVYANDFNPPEMLWGEKMPYLPITIGEAKGFYGCTVSTHLTVRLGDLAISPCHRTAYNKYLYGYFRQDENGKIIGIKANNPQMAVNILMLDSRRSVLGCDSCLFHDICLGTCKGQSIEANKDPLYNDPKVCNFLYRKYEFLFDVLEEYGVMTWLEENLTKNHSAYSSLIKIVNAWTKLKEVREHERMAKLRQDFYRECQGNDHE